MENEIRYHNEELPELLVRAFHTPEMIRLKDVGMHCGCKYTSFPLFTCLKPYSRWTHSYGVASIIYHFTGNLKMALSGAFHDIATPCFSHVIDFLNHDYVAQESTESGTREIIEKSEKIQDLLRICGFETDDVVDYHLYPIADNDSPKLSSDRLEYTLSNIIHFGFADRDSVQGIYDDLLAGENEYGEQELMFAHLEKAKLFGMFCLKTSAIYVCDEDRFSMMRLSILIRDCIRKGYITEEDLYRDETSLLTHLNHYPDFVESWQRYVRENKVQRSMVAKSGYLQIPAKLRFIDPYVQGLGRLSTLDDEFSRLLKNFLAQDFSEYLGPSSFF